MKTKMLPTESLVPHPQNYKIHKSEQVRAIKESIDMHGQYRPLVVANDARTILAGHGVHAALKLANIKECECFVVEHTPDSANALRLLVGDNEIQRMALLLRGDQFKSFLSQFTLDELQGAGITEKLMTTFDIAGRRIEGYEPFLERNLKSKGTPLVTIRVNTEEQLREVIELLEPHEVIWKDEWSVVIK